MSISKGVATWMGIASSVAAAAVPVINQVVALIENTNAHWSSAEKTSLIAGAVIAGVTMLGRFGQAITSVGQCTPR